MASAAQIEANRLNARKSTGPRTAEGKAVVAQNAVRHGLRAEKVVIKGEDPGAFEFYREQMLGELAPAGAMEALLAERVVGLAWRLRRAERMQAEVFDAMLNEDATSPVRKLVRSMRPKAADGPGDGASALGRVVARDFGGSRVLYRLGMYERRIEHSLYRTLNELEKLRLLRELDESTVEARPEPPSRTDDGQARQTKPISAFTGPKTSMARARDTQQSQFCPADSRGAHGNLTKPGDRHRLGAIGINREAATPVGMSGGRPPWDPSHLGKEESR